MSAALLAALTLASGGCPDREGKGGGGSAGGSAGSKARGSGSGSGSRSRRRAPDIPTKGALAQRVLYQQAKSLLLKGRSAAAAAMFRRAIAAHGKGALLASCWLGLGSALGDQKRHAEAVKAYRVVVELRPADPEGYKALAIGLEDAGDGVHARAALERALALDPDALATYQDLATLWLKQKDTAQARAVYKRYERRRRAIVALAGKASASRASRLRALGRLSRARDPRTARWLARALAARPLPHERVTVAMIVALQGQALRVGLAALQKLAAHADARIKRAAGTALLALRGAPAAPASGTGTGTASATGTGTGTGTASATGTGTGTGTGAGTPPRKGSGSAAGKAK